MPTFCSSRALLILSFVTVSFVSGCGCGATADQPGPLARLDVTPAALFFTEAGQTQALTVHGFDAEGRELKELPLTFESSTAAEVSVDAAGTVRAEAAVGSALVRVRSGNIRAPAVTAMVAVPVDGAILVSDAQILSVPTPSTEGQPVAVGGRYKVRLSLAPPAAGAILVGTGMKPLGGRVVGASADGTGSEVELEIVPLPKMLKRAKVNFAFDPGDLRDVLGSVSQGLSRKGQSRQPLKFELGPLECEGDITPGALTLELEPKIASELRPTFALELEDSSVSHFVARVDGRISATAKATAGLGAAVTGEVSCGLELIELPLPVTGLLSVFAAPSLVLSIKVGLSAALQVELFQAGIEASIPVEVAGGLEYTPAGGFEKTATFDLKQTEVTPSIQFPTSVGVRAKGALLAAGVATLAFGGVLGKAELLELSAGPEFEVKYGTLYDVASDPIYNSEYELRLRWALEPGSSIQELLEYFFAKTITADVALKNELALARSPQAVADQLTVDRATFTTGDELTFKVELAPDNLEFPLVGYNVSEVRIYRLDHTGVGTATLLGTAPATPGQTTFTIPWTATFDGETTDSVNGKPTFYAFLVPSLLSTISSALPLELGRVVSTEVPLSACDPTKMFCATALGTIDNKGVALLVHLTEGGKAVVVYEGLGYGYEYPPDGSGPIGIRGSARTLFARSGAHIGWSAGTDHNPTIYRDGVDKAYLPTTDPQVDYWMLNDKDWVIGAIGATQPMRLNGTMVDASKTVTATPELLGLSCGVSGLATDIDEAGRIVGTCDGSVFLWEQGKPTVILPPPAGTTACAFPSLNDRQDILANCTPGTGGETFVWWGAKGTPQQLATVSLTTPVPRMNTKGQVVAGYPQTSDQRLWDNGVVTLLLPNTSFDNGNARPVAFQARAAINNRGEILGVTSGDLLIPGGPDVVWSIHRNPGYTGP